MVIFIISIQLSTAVKYCIIIVLLNVSCRCYIGNCESEQREPFRDAYENVKEHFLLLHVEITLEFLTLKQARESAMTFPKMIKWLLTSHVHFVLTYPHEGLAFTGWPIDNIYKEFKKLTYHAGFPQNLVCPIIIQDKFRYLEMLPDHLKLPTYQIFITESMDMIQCEDDIQR